MEERATMLSGWEHSLQGQVLFFTRPNSEYAPDMKHYQRAYLRPFPGLNVFVLSKHSTLFKITPSTKTFWIRSCIQRIWSNVTSFSKPPSLQNPGYPSAWTCVLFLRIALKHVTPGSCGYRFFSCWFNLARKRNMSKLRVEVNNMRDRTFYLRQDEAAKLR